MVNVSCSTKFHAFALAEQLAKNSMLGQLFTVYHARKNPLIGLLNNRRDPELIPLEKIHTFPALAPLFRLRKDAYKNNRLFDSLVSQRNRKQPDYSAFIGWSGMSYESLMVAKKNGKLCVLERGSCHISHQLQLLREEYDSLGLKFIGDDRVEQQELTEYQIADFITVPSQFAKKSFLDRGFSESKIFVNNFGASSFFSPAAPKNKKFTILYLGALTVQKGLVHLFRALQLLNWHTSDYEVWFIGRVSAEVAEIAKEYRKPNWLFLGHVNHFELAEKISRCSVMVHPSIQEGLSMVIPQVLSCGVPVIATTNTGGEDLIDDGVNGFIVPIRSPEFIVDRLQLLFQNPAALNSMAAAALSRSKVGSWTEYGNRYSDFLKQSGA